MVFLSPGDEMESLTSLDQRRLYDIDDPDVAAAYLDELVGDLAERRCHPRFARSPARCAAGGPDPRPESMYQA